MLKQSSVTLSSRQPHLGIIVFPPPSAGTLAVSYRLICSMPYTSIDHAFDGTNYYLPLKPKAVLRVPLASAVRCCNREGCRSNHQSHFARGSFTSCSASPSAGILAVSHRPLCCTLVLYHKNAPDGTNYAPAGPKAVLAIPVARAVLL